MLFIERSWQNDTRAAGFPHGGVCFVRGGLWARVGLGLPVPDFSQALFRFADQLLYFLAGDVCSSFFYLCLDCFTEAVYILAVLIGRLPETSLLEVTRCECIRICEDKFHCLLPLQFLYLAMYLLDYHF